MALGLPYSRDGGKGRKPVVTLTVRGVLGIVKVLFYQ
jgi:hypothetical protein